MNFITRNLGWLLLFIFFLFMLFVISSNDPQKVTQAGSSINPGVLENMQGNGTGNLDILVDKIEQQDAESNEQEKGGNDSKENSSDVTEEDEENNEANEKTGSGESDEKDGEKKSFFEKLFGMTDRKDSKFSEEEIVTQTEEETQEGNLDEDKKEGEIQKIQIKIPETSQVQETAHNITNSNQNLVKQGSSGIKTIFKDTWNKQEHKNDLKLPGVSIETYIGKTYEVGVYSLKLNNKYFNETLGYLLENDSVKQLTIENSYGCFEAEVLSAKNTVNVGKKGYVCKKYLQDISSMGAEEVISEAQKDEISFQKTNIGDIIRVEKDTTVFAGSLKILAGDSIDQMSEMNASGCFIAHVYQSSIIASQGKVGKVCIQDIR